jgi:hypothetical protein
MVQKLFPSHVANRAASRIGKSMTSGLIRNAISHHGLNGTFSAG